MKKAGWGRRWDGRCDESLGLSLGSSGNLEKGWCEDT